MPLRISLAIATVLSTVIIAVACSPPLIRCETDDHCTSDMKCDVRQGLCVDKGTYIENPDGTPVDGGTRSGGSIGEEGTDCRTRDCLFSQEPPGKDR
jgi:hypothetical protein